MPGRRERIRESERDDFIARLIGRRSPDVDQFQVSSLLTKKGNMICHCFCDFHFALFYHPSLQLVFIQSNKINLNLYLPKAETPPAAKSQQPQLSCLTYKDSCCRIRIIDHSCTHTRTQQRSQKSTQCFLQ